jgi:hypothetical protein
MRRPCITCGAPTDGSYCPAHTRTTSERGYGSAHLAQRRELAKRLPCWCEGGCGRWLTIDSRWVAAHVVDGQIQYGYLVTCQSCNEKMKHR